MVLLNIIKIKVQQQQKTIIHYLLAVVSDIYICIVLLNPYEFHSLVIVFELETIWIFDEVKEAGALKTEEK